MPPPFPAFDVIKFNLRRQLHCLYKNLYAVSFYSASEVKNILKHECIYAGIPTLHLNRLGI